MVMMPTIGRSMNVNITRDEANIVSEQTAQMRRELDYCQSVKRVAVSESQKVSRRSKPMDQSITDVRKMSLDSFRATHLPSSTIPQIHVDDISPSEFRRQFHQGNIPCKLLGLNCREFAALSTKWVLSDGTINRDWFLDIVGDDTLVPVRKQSTGAMDDEGRSEECETAECPMRMWTNSKPEPHLYLKDWHLVKHLQDRGFVQPLYEVPDYFQRDFLNEFLARVTGGDYKFLYWGPAGSHTPMHSDVMNSFSWSYNVVGSKKWVFYLPDEAASVVVHQEAGECIFVPSGWKHDVTNLVETLSINHNWVTSANADRLVDSLITDMQAVEHECLKWGMSVDDLEARESMLRGCAGLDIANCFFLLVSSLLDLESSASATDSVEIDSTLLIQALQSLLNNEENVQLKGRLSSALASDALAMEALGIAQGLLLTFATDCGSTL
jgi:hypothetical protein